MIALVDTAGAAEKVHVRASLTFGIGFSVQYCADVISVQNSRSCMLFGPTRKG